MQRQALGQPMAMVRPSYSTSASFTTAAAITAKAKQPHTAAVSICITIHGRV